MKSLSKSTLTAFVCLFIASISGCSKPSNKRTAYVWVQTDEATTGEIIINQSGKPGEIRKPIKSGVPFEYETQKNQSAQIRVTMPKPFKWAYGCDGLPSEIGETETTSINFTVTPCPINCP